jgi:hypothetical protein
MHSRNLLRPFGRAVVLLTLALALASGAVLAQARELTPRIMVDDGVHAKVRDALERATPILLKVYAALLDVEPSGTPVVSVAWSKRTDAGRSFQADVAPGPVIRFSLSGQAWSEPDSEAVAGLLETLAHELAHMWNSSAYRSEPRANPWLAEGNAELLGAAALLRGGLATPGDTAWRINTAVNGCFGLAGSSAWHAIASTADGLLPSRCGMAIQYVALALAQRRDPALDAFGFWRGFWKAHPVYSEKALVDYARASGWTEAAAFLDDVLGTGPTALDRHLVRGLQLALGLELPRTPRAQFGSQAMRALMTADCNGMYGFWAHNDHFQLEDLPGCKSLKGAPKIGDLAGHDLLREPAQAIDAAKAACARGQPLRLRTLDGRDLAMPCTAAIAGMLPVDPRQSNLEPLRAARVLVR